MFSRSQYLHCLLMATQTPFYFCLLISTSSSIEVLIPPIIGLPIVCTTNLSVSLPIHPSPTSPKKLPQTLFSVPIAYTPRGLCSTTFSPLNSQASLPGVVHGFQGPCCGTKGPVAISMSYLYVVHTSTGVSGLYAHARHTHRTDNETCVQGGVPAFRQDDTRHFQGL
jgi:hypothetical protein